MICNNKTKTWPYVFRGDQGSSDRPLSLAVHCVEHDAFIFALCQDHKLRMWSYKVNDDIYNYSKLE